MKCVSLASTLTVLIAVTVAARRSEHQRTQCPRSCTCRPYTVDCSNADLTSLPPAKTQHRSATVLDISRNKLERIPQQLDSMCPALQKLDASHNRIVRVQHGDFGRLNLSFLSLSWNEIVTIDETAFNNLSHLRELDLSGNRLTRLPPPLFSQLGALRELALDRNLFSAVPHIALAPLTGLHALGLGGNRVTIVKDNTFAQLGNLIVLDLKSNYIERVESEAFAGLSTLNALELEGNMMTSIPTAIGRLTSIQTIKMSSNKLAHVTSGVLQRAPSLERIELRGNPLLTVDTGAFSDMPRLKELELLGLKMLTKFPDLNGTSQLRELRIYGSQLQLVSDHLCHVTRGIKRLYMPSNRLRKVPNLDECSELRFIDLSYNEITRLMPLMFQTQHLLQDLIMRNNRIDRIPGDTFRGLSQLQALDLRYNRITHIDERAFAPLASVRRLNLNNNQFAHLPSAGLSSLTHLYCANNVHLASFPSPQQLSSLRHVQVSYAYHCCQFRAGLTPAVPPADGAHGTNATVASPPEASAVSDSVEGVSESVIFPDSGQLDLSMWNGQMNDVWPEYENLTESMGDLGRRLLTAFAVSEAAGFVNLTQEHEDIDVVTMAERSWWMNEGTVTCSPAPSPFMPCEDLFDWWALRCGVWVVFLLALLGNGTVVIVLVLSRSKLDVPRFLVCNLAAADFFMGVYLGFLAVVDASTLGEFRRHAIGWQMSGACRAAGFLGVFSSELSVFTLAVITLERNYAITHAMHLNKRLSLRHAAVVMATGWLLALLLAALPLVGVSDYRRFAVCLPFQTAGHGLGYLVCLMSANGLAFVVLLACYWKMYCAIRGSQAWNTNDSRIARRMSLLVFTDFVCWAPIAFFSLTAAAGIHLVGLSAAKVFTVFVLPFNSCCNPFLYAILTKQFKKDCVLICKAIEETRVTRSLGRARHSSNFSNRHTPANTNSLAERTSKMSGAVQAQCSCQYRHQHHQQQQQQSQQQQQQKQRQRHLPERATTRTATQSKPGRWQVLCTLFWCPSRVEHSVKRSRHGNLREGAVTGGGQMTARLLTAAAAGASDSARAAAPAAGTAAVATSYMAGDSQCQRTSSLSSNAFNSSRTNSLRQNIGCIHCRRQPAEHGQHLPLQPHQSRENQQQPHHHQHHRYRKRRRNSWSVTRRTSQESNLSTSRNDSSATAGSNATQSWQLSRSSVSSDTGSAPAAGAPILGVARAAGDSDSDVKQCVGQTGILKKAQLVRQTATTDDVTVHTACHHHQPGCPLHCPGVTQQSPPNPVREGSDYATKAIARRTSSGRCGQSSAPSAQVPTIIEAIVEKTSPPQQRMPLLVKFVNNEHATSDGGGDILGSHDASHHCVTPELSFRDTSRHGQQEQVCLSVPSDQLQLPNGGQNRCRSAEHVSCTNQTLEPTATIGASVSDTCIHDVSTERLRDWLINVRSTNENRELLHQPMSSECSSPIQSLHGQNVFNDFFVESELNEQHPLL